MTNNNQCSFEVLCLFHALHSRTSFSRKSEHLDDEIIRSLHPTDTWIGHVSTGRFPAEDGVEHTFDRFENVFPDLSGCWEDVTATSCVGKPCDPTETKIGLGFTRDSYKLQRKSYATDLFCFDQILSCGQGQAAVRACDSDVAPGIEPDYIASVPDGSGTDCEVQMGDGERVDPCDVVLEHGLHDPERVHGSDEQDYGTAFATPGASSDS